MAPPAVNGCPARVEVHNRTRACLLASRCQVATSFRERVIGLLGRRGLQRGEGLWIHRCSSIHMIGMRFAIDVIFIDRDGVVVGMAPQVRPLRFRWCRRGAQSALELPTGTIAESGTRLGDMIEFLPVDPSDSEPGPQA